MLEHFLLLLHFAKGMNVNMYLGTDSGTKKVTNHPKTRSQTKAETTPKKNLQRVKR
jgi:hypothetical protein